MGMVEAAKKLLTASDATTPPLPSGSATPAPQAGAASVLAGAAAAALPPLSTAPSGITLATRPHGSAFHLLAPSVAQVAAPPLPVAMPAPAATVRRGGGRKRKGERRGAFGMWAAA